MKISRALELLPILEHRSLFLLGPRQTGKSWLIRNSLSNCRLYNLLNSRTFLRLSREPSLLEQELRPNEKIVVIDEIQKLPNLLDEVHRLIEEKQIRFLLTGSSARKLRRGGVNLLGGRARIRTLHPFTYLELGGNFDLIRALDIGLLPSIYFSDDTRGDLEAYAGLYLQQEVAAEGLTRQIPAFSRFLEVAALCNSQMLNYTKISNDAQVSRSTVIEYFGILYDTLLASELPAWRSSKKRKAITTSKFFFFDIGVARRLQHRGRLNDGAPEVGEAFESWLHHELRTYIDTRGQGDLRYWRSTSNMEVDFILNDQIAIEAKASKNVSPYHLKGLRALREEALLKRYILVCREETPRKVDGIDILPWHIFLEMLQAGELDG